jgi:hypothetical protein
MFIAQVTDSFKNDFITILAQNAKIKHLQKQRFMFAKVDLIFQNQNFNLKNNLFCVTVNQKKQH